MRNTELFIFLRGISPSRVARTASIALSNIFTPLLQSMADAARINPIAEERSWVSGTVLFI